MRPMKCDSKILAGLGAILAGAATVAAAQVPQPPINGVVVQDVTQTFSFDRIGVDYETGPYTVKDHYQGTVRSMVVQAPDDTFDFYFHISASTTQLRHFTYLWQVTAYGGPPSKKSTPSTSGAESAEAPRT